MMTSSDVQRWDVWLCYLHFLDHPDTGKVRPVVVVEDDGASLLVAKITTSTNLAFPAVEIADWVEAGLRKPSRVQIDPLFAIHKDELLREAPVGSLSSRDRAVLRASLSWAE